MSNTLSFDDVISEILNLGHFDLYIATTNRPSFIINFVYPMNLVDRETLFLTMMITDFSPSEYSIEIISAINHIKPVTFYLSQDELINKLVKLENDLNTNILSEIDL